MRPAVIVLETHATSLDNEAGVASGWYDVGLSPAGEAQARLLGARRADETFALVYCSDLTRSFRTAELAFGGRDLPIVRDARLRECDYGELTRRPAAEIDLLRARSVTTPFPGGESYEGVAGRVRAWLDDLPPACTGQRVLVIGHRATFYAFEHLLAGVPLVQAVTAPWRWQAGWIYRG